MSSKVTISANWGSRPVAKRVLSFDPNAGYASVLYRYMDGTEATDTVPLSELEALEENRCFVDLKTALLRRAEHVIQ